MLVWYSMLNTIPEASPPSHSAKCSNNTGNCSLVWPDRGLTPLEQLVRLEYFKVVFWHIDMQDKSGAVNIGIFHYHK
jgi:hypothetical protein